MTVAVANPIDQALVEDLTTHVRRNAAPRRLDPERHPAPHHRLLRIPRRRRSGRRAGHRRASTSATSSGSSRSRASRRSRRPTATSSRPSSTCCTTRSTSARPTCTSSRGATNLGRAHAHRRRPALRCIRCPSRCTPPVVSRLKTLARLDIAEKRRPQDGRIKTSRGDHEVELRVSTVSTAFGEKLVMRIFDPEAVLRGLCELGMFDAQLAHHGAFLRAPERSHPRDGPDRQRQDVDALRGLAHRRDAPR